MLVLVVLLVLPLPVFQPRVRATLGIADYGRVFLDSYAVLATIDAYRAGISPDAPNPLDPLMRNHKYSDWWLALRHLPLTRDDNVAVATAWIAAFLLVLFLTVAPQSYGESAWMMILILSPPVFLGVERANNDLLVFVTAGLALIALRRGSLLGDFVAIAALGVATGLKFYPVVAGFVLVELMPVARRNRALAVAAVALGLVMLDVGSQMKRGIFGVPTGVHVFGADFLLSDLELPQAAFRAIALAVPGILGLLLAQAQIFGERNSGVRESDDARSFTVGAVLLLACFTAGANFGYRMIFGLWLAPWVWSQAQSPVGTQGRRAARILLWALPAFLWLDGLFCLVVNLCLPGRSTQFYNQLQLIWRFFTQPLVWGFCAILAAWLFSVLFAVIRARSSSLPAAVASRAGR